MDSSLRKRVALMESPDLVQLLLERTVESAIPAWTTVLTGALVYASADGAMNCHRIGKGFECSVVSVSYLVNNSGMAGGRPEKTLDWQDTRFFSDKRYNHATSSVTTILPSSVNITRTTRNQQVKIAARANKHVSNFDRLIRAARRIDH